MASQPAIIQDEETLPEGWVAYDSTVPRKYYYNEKTRISQWEKPTKRKHKKIGSYDANVAVRKYNKILEIFEKTLCGFYPSTTPEYDHIINRMKLEVEENCTELHNKRLNERKVTNNLLSNEAWLMLFVEKLLKVMQVKQSIINDEEAKQYLKNEYLDKLNRAKKNSDKQEELGICIFVDKLLMILEPRKEEAEDVSEPFQETLGSWESSGQMNVDQNENLRYELNDEDISHLMNSDLEEFPLHQNDFGIHQNGSPEVRTQLQSDSYKRPAEMIDSEPVNHTPKVRVIPSDEVNLNDDTFYLYVANRFHPCFLPTTVKERFISILFNEENSNNVSDEQLLRKLKEEEDADVKDLWGKVGIPFVQISAEGEGITQALLKKVRKGGNLTLALKLFQNSVKSTEYNKVQFAKYNHMNRKISDNKEDNRMWDNTVPGAAVAVPWIRPFLRHYFDVSKKFVTIIKGKNLDKDLTITVHEEEIQTIKHTESECMYVPREIGQDHETIVIQTNHCLIFCANNYIHKEDVEISSFNSESRHELVEKQKVFIVAPKERNGLLLGYHLDLSEVMNVNGIPIDDSATFKKFLWTPHIALLDGVNVQEIESLSIRGKFDEDEIRDDRLLWPMPKNMIRTL